MTTDRPTDAEIAAAMDRAIELAAEVRAVTSPNPWVGCVILPGGHAGATAPAGGPHAEVSALAAAGEAARGATLVATLEPCSHHGRTPPCVEAVVKAGVARVVVAIVDPDPRVAGSGLAALRRAGVAVEVGVRAQDVARQLAPYITHRRTGRPYVVVKLATTLDGRTAAPDGTSRWITGPEARADAHLLRAESDMVAVGANTARRDDPSLTVRIEGRDHDGSRPRRAVFGRLPANAAMAPATELEGELGSVLDRLGAEGVVQLLVEGGATLAGSFHRAGLVDRYVFYLAPALLGGDDGTPVMTGTGASGMADLWRGRIDSVRRLGADLRLDMVPA